MIVKDVITTIVRGKSCYVGYVYNDSTETYLDGELVMISNTIKSWMDAVGNTFTLCKNGNIYQIEFWEENKHE